MNTITDPLHRLDAVQLKVASATPDARTLVIAGPGTGKTEVAAGRLLHLLTCGVPPAHILVLSFSRSATRTLTRRIEDYPGAGPAVAEELRHVSVRTFDSWTFRILRLLGHAPIELLRQGYEENIATLVRAISGDQRQQFLNRVPRIEHVIVDELQDLGGVRGALVLELLRVFCGKGPGGAGFTVLGDEAQGIYGFAARDGAADYAELTAKELFRRIRDDYKTRLNVVVLEKNYRSATRLASLAKSLRNILTREGITAADKLDAMQKLFSRVPAVEELKEVIASARLKGNSTAILTQTNGDAIRVAKLLAGDGDEPPALSINLQTVGRPYRAPAWVGATLGPFKGSSISRSQFAKLCTHLYSGKDAALAQAIRVPDEETAWLRLCYAAGLPRVSTSIDLSELRARLSWPDSFPDDEAETSGLKVMTVHQSKGQEFDEVAVMEPASRPDVTGAGENAGDKRGRNGKVSDAAVEESASVIFVALTRAAKSVKRLESSVAYAPLTVRQFQCNRKRWQAWRNGWVNLEIGIAGDITPTSFIDARTHGGEAEVDALQQFLARDAHKLRGHKVQLAKRPSADNDRNFVYGIHLQEGEKQGRLLGVTEQQLTIDLLDRIWSAGYQLPQRIYNLRISDVVTFSSTELPPTVSSRYSTSGIWNGVELYGIGDFKPFKRNGR